MATKKECDRCGKQWQPTPGETDEELCQIGVFLPYAKALPPTANTKAWTDRPKIADTLDLCQRCARAAYEFITTKPEEYGDHK